MRKTLLIVFLAPAISLSCTPQTSPPITTQKVHANLNQLMQAPYPAANVFILRAKRDPGALSPPVKDPRCNDLP
jgi:hypothetical protein